MAGSSSQKPLSLRAYAQRIGVSVEAVSQAIKAGRLVKSVARDSAGRPKIADPVLADREWAANTDQSKPRNAITGDPKHRREPGAPMRPMGDVEAPSGGGPSYAQSRAIREAYQARLSKLEYEEKSGKLVSADHVRVTAYNSARTARDALLNIPDRVAGVLAGITDEREVHRVLTDEIRRVVNELSRAASVAATAEN